MLTDQYLPSLPLRIQSAACEKIVIVTTIFFHFLVANFMCISLPLKNITILEANNMKNKLSFALLCVTLCCSFSVLAYAENTDSDETPLAYEMSEDELNDVMETCHQLGVDSGVSNDGLPTFVSECVDANDYDTGDGNLEESTLQIAQETCNEIAMEDELQGNELTTFLAECVEANASAL
ncbi:hypothetical protein [Leucothrix mucor]|uniref:hypothetical protein n=1 Tax=Leucothrix mucor TaxID=45248 RepID=UPI0012F9A82E|nr:hypothetical protein [Leucothrix mucor]